MKKIHITIGNLIEVQYYIFFCEHVDSIIRSYEIKRQFLLELITFKVLILTNVVSFKKVIKTNNSKDFDFFVSKY
jgi:hypothetical protein